MVFYDNGIIVQDSDKDAFLFGKTEYFDIEAYKNYRSYRGLGRYLSYWPLELENDPLSKQLTNDIEKWLDIDANNPLEKDLNIVPEKRICIRYIKHCRNKGINIRVLFCRTELEVPQWDSLLPNLNILGYDYCTGVPYFSPIPDDLLMPNDEFMNHPAYKELIQCSQKLNKYKLFDNENDLKTYIEKRQKVIESDIQWGTDNIDGKEYRTHLIEAWVEPRIIQLAEVTGELWEKGKRIRW
jgi:hypothetical protein